jgi:hypothetical protein
MQMGGLDILCVLPRSKVLQYGIPYVHSIIECDIPEWEVETCGIFWIYFIKQWITIFSDGTSKMTKPDRLLK